jgi:hypothetical protein
LGTFSPGSHSWVGSSPPSAQRSRRPRWKENVICTPETFEVGFAIPDGYRMLSDGEYLFVVECVEDVQVFDSQFEPI